MKNAIALAILASTFTMVDSVEARPFRVDQVPNGDAANCLTCHATANGGVRNAFGSAIESSLNGDEADWSQVYDLDSDGDGYSNGLELGDPDGTWVIGDPNPEGATSKPGDSGSTLCGDGIVNADEACDGDVGAAVCTDLSVDHEGTVVCTDCAIDYDGCVDPNAPTNNTNNATNNATNTSSNNSTNSTNNTTNNATNNATNNQTTTPTTSSSDDEGCSATGAMPTIWLAMMALFGFRRRI